MHNNLTGKHLECKPLEKGRVRNEDKCVSDMYPCYDNTNEQCYNVDGDVAVNLTPNMSKIGNRLRNNLRSMPRVKNVKIQKSPKF